MIRLRGDPRTPVTGRYRSITVSRPYDTSPVRTGHAGPAACRETSFLSGFAATTLSWVTSARPRRPEGQQVSAPVSMMGAAGAVAREPVILVLLAVSFFTAISGKPVDAVLLLLVVIALAWDAGRRARSGGDGTGAAPSGRPRRSRRQRYLAAGTLVAGGVVYAVAVGSFSRYSWPATAGVAALGAVAVVTGWWGPLRWRPVVVLPVAGAALWAGVFVAGCLWELSALLQQPSFTVSSAAHPTISTLTDPVLAGAPGRSLVLGAWLALGMYLARR